MTDRPYRKGRAPWQAVCEIDACAGTQFDPAVVEVFKRIVHTQVIEQEQEVTEVGGEPALASAALPGSAAQGNGN